MPYRARRTAGQETIDLTEMTLMQAIVELSHGKFIPPRHLSRLIEFFEAADAGCAKPTIVSIPRRHGKSTTCCAGIAWYLARHPDKVSAYTSYSQRLADRMSRDIRRKHEFAGGQFSPDENRVEGWRTPEDGGLIAVGVQGPMTGFGVSGIAVGDDWIKDRADAESQQIKDMTWDWSGAVFFNCIEPGAVPLIIGTRWAQDDPIGRLLNGQLEEYREWDNICLPAISIDSDGNERALWEEIWPLTRLLQKRGRFGGGKEWHSQFMQNPLPDGGSLFGAPTFGEWIEDVERPILRAI